MKEQTRRWTLALATAVALTTLPAVEAVAKPGHKGGHKHGVGPARGAGHGHEGRFTPPGWSRGRKTGWGDSNRPPGLRNRFPAGHDRDRDRDRDRKHRDRHRDHRHDHGHNHDHDH